MNTLDPSGCVPSPNPSSCIEVTQLIGRRYISGRLYRGETRYVDGKHVKDLSFLNRDLRHVIMIDAHPEAFQAQPENGIRIKAWTNDPADRDLVELTPLLEAVFREDVNDIRPLLSQWQGQHVATKFRELNDEYELRKAEGRLPSSSASLLRGVPQQGGPFTLLNIPCGPQAPPPPPASASPPPPPIKEKDPLNIVTGGGLKSLLGK